MIRLAQRHLIIPRGDTGTFSIPMLATTNTGDYSVFTIFDPLLHKKIFEKIMTVSDGVLSIDFTHNDTVNLPVGEYVWDIKFYKNALIVDDVFINGDEVDSYYAAFKLPICEIRETGDSLLMADDAPESKISPTQLNIITAAINDMERDRLAAASSASDAADAKDTAVSKAGEAANSAEIAAQALADLQAIVYTIPTKVSDLPNDANYAVDANYVHTDNNYTTAEKIKLEGIAAGAEVNVNADWNAVSGDAQILNKPTNVSAFTNDAGYITNSDVPVKDVQINSTSILGANGVANIPYADSEPGVIRVDNKYGLTNINTYDVNTGGSTTYTTTLEARPEDLKAGTDRYKIISARREHQATFYGLAKAAGDSTQSASDNAVGTYTTEAKTAIQTMLDVPSNATVTSAISTAIGNVHQFNLSIVQELPAQDIDTHTIYLIPKTGDTNDVYDEYVYINDAWEMIGNTQIDLSNYVQKTDYASADNAGVVKTQSSFGVGMFNSGIITNTLAISPANSTSIKRASSAQTADSFKPIVPSKQHESAFYGLAKAAGDSTQSASANAVGTYTNEAKAAIQQMLGVSSAADVTLKADKADTVLDTTLSRGRKANTTVGTASIAFGVDAEASGYYSTAIGLNTSAVSQGAFAEGKNTVARYIAHAEGEDTQALGQWAHSQGVGTVAKGAASFAGGDNTIANGHSSFVTGRYNVADSYDDWTFWAANTSYNVGDKVKREQLVNSEPTIIGYICKEANTDETFDISHWDFDSNHMNYSVIVGNGYEAEDSETHETVRHGSNAYALDWDGNGYYKGDVYVGANADSSGGTKLADVSELALKADKTDTVLLTTLSRGRKANTTIGVGSFAFGDNVEASNVFAYAEGAYSAAKGNTSHAEGSMTIANGQGSHAEGSGTTANGLASHAEGQLTTANGLASHAEGRDTIADKDNSHAEGKGTRAYGLRSHAEGTSTISNGANSHAEGAGTISNGGSSHAEGLGTVANGSSSHTSGKYNVEDSYNSWLEWAANTEYVVGDKVKITTIINNETTVDGYICKTDNTDAEFNLEHWNKDYYINFAETIGNGTADNARSNAYALTWTGDGHYAGDIYINCNNDSTGGEKLVNGLKVVRLI